jgi:ectoine hydroxylase-related dioxygenase (phytanoyl-CoA dioxygenase family)
MPVTHVPRTATPAQVIEVLRRDGAVIIDQLLGDTGTRQLAADADHWLAQAPSCQGHFFGFKTQRVGTMVEKSAVCRDMVLDPTVLAVTGHFLLPHCTQYQLMVSQLIAINPGERQQIIHADDPMFPFAKPGDMQVMVNTMWAIDDFTEDNGATHIVPGSHAWPRGERLPQPDEVCQSVMTKGSCLIWLGSSFHAGGANRTTGPRRSVAIAYNLGWMKSQENYYLSIPLDTVRSYPARLQELLGFFVHRPNLNTVEGRDPAELLQIGAPASPHQLKEYQEFIPSAAIELIKQYHAGNDVAATEAAYKHEA